MTKREINLLIANSFQQLRLINEALEEFEEIEGKRGVQKRIDFILDEINYHKKLLKKLEEDES